MKHKYMFKFGFHYTVERGRKALFVHVDVVVFCGVEMMFQITVHLGKY